VCRFFYALLIVLLMPSDIAINARGRPIRIVSEAASRITKVLVHEGSEVRAGDTLVQLDRRDLLVQQRALETQIHLAELGPHSTQLRALYEQLEKTKIEIGQLTITSPTNGRITSLGRLYEGGMLKVGDIVGTIVPEVP
jgi:multidrug resistance efflux pump